MTHSAHDSRLRFDQSTLRNRNLITKAQQQRLKKTVVGFFGLSVGSHAALTWMMESRADVIKIADPDTIEPTNLNRLRYGWDTVGKRKTDVVRAQLGAINPDAKVFMLNKTDQQSIKRFVRAKPAAQLIVEETDDLSSKILLRRLAKEKKIPVLSAVDVGDNVLLDIERWDLSPQPELFLGRLGRIEDRDLGTLEPRERMKLVIGLVGLDHNSEAMLDSLLAIGTTLPTWPQLGATATIAGGVITTTIKKIILGESVETGRYILSLDELLVKGFSGAEQKRQRARLTRLVTQKFL